MPSKIGSGFFWGVWVWIRVQFLKNANYYPLSPPRLGITQRLTNQKRQFCCSGTFHRIYLRLISVSFPRFQSFLHFMKSQFGATSSFLMKSSIFQNQIFKDKSEILLKFALNWLSYISNTISGWYHFHCYFNIVSNLLCHDLLPTVSCGRQKVMTSAKGSAFIQNLCYKCLRFWD